MATLATIFTTVMIIALVLAIFLPLVLESHKSS